jgi:two-component system chemotaxis sensor kinase CheA
MSSRQPIASIAKALALVDAGDLQSLVALHDLLIETAGGSTPSDGSVRDTLAEAAGLVEGIILRQFDDVDATLQRLASLVDELDAEEAGNVDDAEPASVNPAELIDDELLSAWLAECDTGLAEAEAAILSIEHADPTSPDGEVVAEIRRRIHTLKGECGVLSLDDAQAILHDAEWLIDETTERHAAFPCTTLIAVVDWMRHYAAALSEGSATPDDAEVRMLLDTARGGHASNDASQPESQSESQPADADAPAPAADASDAAPLSYPDGIAGDETTVEFAAEAREHLAGAEASLLEIEADADDPEHVNVVFRAFHTIKGVAGFINLAPIVDLAHAAETMLDRARSGRLELRGVPVDLAIRSCDMLRQLVEAIDGGPFPAATDHRALIASLLDAAEGRSIEPLASPTPSPRIIEEPTAAEPPSASAPTDTTTPVATTESGPNRGNRRVDQTVKVSTTRMDGLVDMVGELVIAQLMVTQDPSIAATEDQRLRRHLAHMGKIVRDLQEVAMSLRMVTLRQTFQKMRRLVRDVAAKAGKTIELSIEGEDVELDRNVVEEIGDPLVHMIRNACDHGVEPADERIRAGKPGTGHVTLRAFHKGGSIVIEIEDDGRGLSRDRILAKCLERNLIDDSRRPEDIPDHEVYNFIFLPGFSTAEKITDISGRGVGMDVVRRNIEALRGSVEIRSTPGRGSVFSMRLPLTMAIIDGMVVRVGSQRYVIPTLSIEQSFRPRPDQLSSVLGRGEMVEVREKLLPIHRLNRMFDLREGAQSLDEGLLLVLEAGGRRAAVLVDEILGQQQVVIKRLGDGTVPTHGVSGGAILGDGRVALILDPNAMVEGVVAAAA